MTTGAARREPFLLGTIGAVVGIVLALVVFGGFGGSGNVAATASLTTLPAESVVPSPSLAAVVTVAPTVEVTAPPATVAPPSVAPPTATPSPAPNASPVIVSFETPKQEDCTNSTAGSVHVSWSIKRASGVSISIDGPGIFNSYAGLTGEIDLPYGCDANKLQHTYTLTTVGGTGPAATITKTIKTRAPSIVSFSVGKPDCSGGESFVGINVSYEVRAATGARLERDGALYSTYGVKATDDIVMYDCSQADQKWTLTTTGGYGPAATRSITVGKD